MPLVVVEHKDGKDLINPDRIERVRAEVVQQVRWRTRLYGGAQGEWSPWTDTSSLYRREGWSEGAEVEERTIARTSVHFASEEVIEYEGEDAEAAWKALAG